MAQLQSRTSELTIKLSGLLGVLLGLSVAAASARAEPRSLEFTPHAGFNGHSEGHGTLRLFLGRQRLFHVESDGYDQADGTFRLDQFVTFQGKPGEQRSWLIRSLGHDRYRASLSDAAGPVIGLTQGARLLLQYRVKGPFVMHQTLELMADGTTIDNVGTITLLGIPVGRLHETITRQRKDTHTQNFTR